MMNALAIFVAISAGISGVAFLIVGLRGRLAGERAYCKRCGYDVTARSVDSSTCAECGADLSLPRAIRIGQRQRRRRPLVAGILLFAVALMIGGNVSIAKLRAVNWISYRPASWLMKDVFIAPTNTERDAAMDELLRRTTLDRLSQSSADTLAKLALADQANLGKAWLPKWAQVIEAMHATHRLSDEDWKRYAQQCFQITMLVRPTVRQGDPVPMQVVCKTDRLGTANFRAIVQWIDLNVGNEHATEFLARRGPSGEFRLSNGDGLGGSTYYTPTFNPHASLDFPLGPQQLVGQMKFWIKEGVGHSADAIPTTPPADALKEWTITTSSSFEVLKADAPITIVDPSLRKAVRDALKIDRLSVRDGKLFLEMKIEKPPIQMNFHVFSRLADGREARFGDVGSYGHDRRSSSLHALGGEQMWPPTFTSATTRPSTVDLIFRVDEESAAQRIDDSKAWGEEVTIRKVPVNPYSFTTSTR